MGDNREFTIHTKRNSDNLIDLLERDISYNGIGHLDF